MPADHGPIAVYWTPRQAIAAWSASVSNDSATKSAIGHRQDAQDRPAVVAAEAAERPPELEPGERVAEPGRLDVGRRPRRRSRRGSPPSERTSRSNADVAPRRRRPTARAGPRRSGRRRPTATIAPPSGRGAKARTSGADERQPVALEVEVADDRRPQPADGVGQRRDAGARRQLGRSRPRRRRVARRSRTSVRSPALPRYAAATRPLWPPPMTIAS